MRWDKFNEPEAGCTYVKDDSEYEKFKEKVVKDPDTILREFRMPKGLTVITLLVFTTKRPPGIQKLNDRVQELTTSKHSDVMGLNVIGVFFEDGIPNKGAFNAIGRRIRSRFIGKGQIFIKTE